MGINLKQPRQTCWNYFRFTPLVPREKVVENKHKKCLIYICVEHPKTTSTAAAVGVWGFSRELLRARPAVVHLCSPSCVALQGCWGADSNSGGAPHTEAINLHSSIYHCMCPEPTSRAGSGFKGLLFLTRMKNSSLGDLLKCHLGVLALCGVRADIILCAICVQMHWYCKNS